MNENCSTAVEINAKALMLPLFYQLLNGTGGFFFFPLGGVLRRPRALLSSGLQLQHGDGHVREEGPRRTSLLCPPEEGAGVQVQRSPRRPLVWRHGGIPLSRGGHLLSNISHRVGLLPLTEGTSPLLSRGWVYVICCRNAIVMVTDLPFHRPCAAQTRSTAVPLDSPVTWLEAASRTCPPGTPGSTGPPDVDFKTRSSKALNSLCRWLWDASAPYRRAGFGEHEVQEFRIFSPWKTVPELFQCGSNCLCYKTLMAKYSCNF